jgi:hypothetical protein
MEGIKMLRYYYCLVAGLPEIFTDQQKLPFTLIEFKKELSEVLHPLDYKLAQLIFLSYDNSNLLNILLKKEKPYQDLGNYSQEEMEEGIREPELLRNYLHLFIEEFKTAGDTEEHTLENRLTYLYLEEVRQTKNIFLKDWFNFTLMLNNILAAYNARKHNFDIDEQIIGDDEIIETMKRSQARDFGIMADVPFVDKVIGILENKSLMEREKNLDMMKWSFLDELTIFNYFTIEIVLSYILKLTIIERWMKLDVETGNELFRKLNEKLTKGYEFQKEFQINERK